MSDGNILDYTWTVLCTNCGNISKHFTTSDIVIELFNKDDYLKDSRDMICSECSNKTKFIKIPIDYLNKGVTHKILTKEEMVEILI